jgi:hypothetical protein
MRDNDLPPLIVDDATRRHLEMELPVELRSMRRRYAPLGQTYVAALGAEVAALAAEQLRAPWAGVTSRSHNDSRNAGYRKPRTPPTA